jgi:hypothetical protein
MAIPSTRERVPAHTAENINESIEREIAERVRRLANQPSQIGARLQELDEEWDIERAIEANASALAFLGTALGFFLHPYWLALPALVTAFLFQHAVQGWCPPVPVLRRLGFRTIFEIDRERHALKAARGDYAGVASASDKAAAALAAARA